MTPETKKTLLLAGAAVIAGGVSVPILSWVGGKTFSLAGAVGPYIAPVGAAVAGAALAAAGRKHPAVLGAGVALAAVGGYGIVASYQAEKASKQASSVTSGNLYSMSGAGGGARMGGGGGGGRGGGAPRQTPAPPRGGPPRQTPAPPRGGAPRQTPGTPPAGARPVAPPRAGLPAVSPALGGGGGGGGGGGHHGHHHPPHPGPNWWGSWWGGNGWGYPSPIYIDGCAYSVDAEGNQWCTWSDGTTRMIARAPAPTSPVQATGSGHLPPSFARRLTGQHRTWASIQG